ncbi:MAG TPA: beta-ketoacyl synthase N-terminal-like domain-containing protein [Acidobacteriota bacterium]|nr:beta-ketoacyl synthase N-terminal-like domain-containing protein [Acidobacteriota bacterium]
MPQFEMRVVVTGTGARTSVGRTALATAAAIRAGIAMFNEHPFMRDTAGNRMVVALAPYLEAHSLLPDRLAELAGPAAMEATSLLARSEGQKPLIPVFVGLPRVRPGRAKDLGVIAKRVRDDASGAGLRIGKVTMIETGHSAGAMAIQAAWDLVRSGAAEFVLAGGVDSYLEPETLEWLEANDQLHSAGPTNNSYGFIPGEAGSFALLATARAAERQKLSSSTELVIAATTQETKLIKTDAVCLGEGLAALFRALSGVPAMLRADHLYCDMNGEPYRADEFGFATIRSGGIFRDPSSFTTPADCWGDVGAASGPLFLMLADAAIKKGYAPGPILAAFTSSESGERCGFVARDRNVQETR